MTFKLTFLNPCIDTDFVKIEAPTKLADYVYIIDSDAILYNHPLFTVTTKPLIDHTLCEGLIYQTTVDTEVIDSNDEPISYKKSSQLVTILSDDLDLDGK